MVRYKNYDEMLASGKKCRQILADAEWDSLDKVPDPMWPDRVVHKYPGWDILKNMGYWETI